MVESAATRSRSWTVARMAASAGVSGAPASSAAAAVLPARRRPAPCAAPRVPAAVRPARVPVAAGAASAVPRSRPARPPRRRGRSAALPGRSGVRREEWSWLSIPRCGHAAAPADTVVRDPGRFHRGGIVQVAAIEDRRLLERCSDAIEIRAAEDLPLGHHRQRVGAFQCGPWLVAQDQVVACPVDARGFLACLRIERAHPCTGLPQGFHQHPAGCLAHVVGIGFEGETPQRDGPVPQLPAEVPRNLLEQLALLLAVDRFHRAQHARLVAVGARGAFQRLHVLGETRAAVSRSGIDEGVTDARIGTDAVPHHLHVRTHALGDVGDLVLRSGFMQSLTASPSFRNSGLDTTSNSTAALRAFNAAAISARTRSAVPTGTVDLFTITAGLSRCVPMLRATATTYCRSALPSSSGGVPTAMKITCPCATPAAPSVVNVSRPVAWLRLTSGSSPGSKIGISPRSRRATLAASTSTHST